MQALVKKLQTDHDHLTFVAGTSFYWCPETAEVFYDASKARQPSSIWSLLHETSHGLLAHTAYRSDVELLYLEVEAWEHAAILARRYNIVVDEDYVQDCLDTYRDWLYRRSLCPGCGNQCLQLDNGNFYRCFNCRMRWHVSPSRFCRPYRRAQVKNATGTLIFANKAKAIE